MKYIALALALLMCVSSAQAYRTVALKESSGNDHSGTQNIVMDDVTLRMGSDENQDNNWCLVAGNDWGQMHVFLVGIKDLFAQLPDSLIASPTDIISAEFTIYHRWPAGSEIVDLYQVTTPWLLQPAGDNETTATSIRRLPGGANPWWADGEVAGFGPNDYAATPSASLVITTSDPYEPNVCDATALVRSMYTEGNDSFVGICRQPQPDPNNGPYFLPGENRSHLTDEGYEQNPTLKITYVPEPVTIGLLAIGGIAALLRKRR